MQRKLTTQRRSDDEAIKETGLLVDFDEIARKGKMSAEESLAAKWYGVYTARQPGNFMLRVVLPGGVLTSAQARALAQISENYAQGRVSLTTRQCVQLHWVKLFMIPMVLRDLDLVGLSTFHGCGDVTRNVTACPWATDCPHRRLDVQPMVQRTAALLSADRDLDNLPRKFKIAFSGCGADCALNGLNCVGLTALTRRGPDGGEETGFSVVMGGGNGWKPMAARPLYSFVPEDQVPELCRAIAQFFRDNGDRYDRSLSRLKFVVQRLGIPRCRQEISRLLSDLGGDPAQLEIGPVEDCGEAWPNRPQALPAPSGTSGLVIQSFAAPNAELKFHQLRRLAQLSEMFGDKQLQITPRQKVEIHGVRPDHRPRLVKELKEIGLNLAGLGGLADIVACVGTKYCPLAVCQTHEMVELLRPVVQAERFGPICQRVNVNVCGCPNGCSPYAFADIGLRGMRIREDQGSVEGYQLWLGGSHRRVGEVLGDFKNEDCVRVVDLLLETFLSLSEGEESLTQCVKRVGLGPFRQKIDSLNIAYDMAPAPRELNIITGIDTSPLALKTAVKDIPCQGACPAGTDVPGYLQLIAHGDMDGAYRLNQEENIFPGVLGRVCTRPCEAACRHQSTGTMGPVAICHLKRYAADNRETPCKPLPPWFEPTGHRVAVVGGGPAGLAAARELRRYGHEVTLLERDQELGGMMRYGIPLFRLPREVVDEEVQAILDSGVQAQLGEQVDRGEITSLLEQYDALLLAAGASRPRMLDLDGLPEGAAMGGLSFIKGYNRGQSMDVQKADGDVLVIGGGFTAIDCARAARRLVGDHRRVRIIYRRTEGQMSASPHELMQVRLEGIEMETLVSPISVRMGPEGMEAVTMERNQLEENTGDGKPPISVVPDSTFEVPCGTLIFAIGQTRTLEILPEDITLEDGGQTSHQRLFVAGDFSTGSLDVVHAVGEGKAAADAIDQRLMGRSRRREQLVVESLSGDTGRLRDHDLANNGTMPILSLEDRRGDQEVETGLDSGAAEVNSWRCYLCNYKLEIQQDQCIHCDWCIKASPRDCIRKLTRFFADEDGAVTNYVETTVPREATFIWIDSDQCIRCGNCLRICPTEAISLRRLRLTHHCGDR